MHLEEDAGKLLHEGFPDSDRSSYVDLNRAGTPLIEIVTEPDLRAAERRRGVLRLPARAARRARRQRREHGGGQPAVRRQRVRPRRRAPRRSAPKRKSRTSTRSGSWRRLSSYEIQRQIDALDAGERVVQETRLWDPAAKRTVSMRSKEEAHDYRYFPEPDLPPLVMDAARLQQARDDAAGIARRAPAAADGGLCAHRRPTP